MDDIFFKEDDLEVGGETEAFCPGCKTDTLHTVVTMFEGELRSVQCTICNATHAFRPPRGEADDDVPEPIAVKRRQSLRKRPWAEVVAGASAAATPGYSPRERYGEGAILNHPVFGVGYVSELVADTKFEGVFKDGPRILVHNRPDLPAPKGQPPAQSEVRQATGAALSKKAAAVKATAKATKVKRPKSAPSVQLAKARPPVAEITSNKATEQDKTAAHKREAAHSRSTKPAAVHAKVTAPAAAKAAPVRGTARSSPSSKSAASAKGSRRR